MDIEMDGVYGRWLLSAHGEAVPASLALLRKRKKETGVIDDERNDFLVPPITRRGLRLTSKYKRDFSAPPRLRLPRVRGLNRKPLDSDLLSQSDSQSCMSDESGLSTEPSLISGVIPRSGDWKASEFVDRTDWIAAVSARHRELAELRERLKPTYRGATSSTLFRLGSLEVKDFLNRENVLQLIMQYLTAQGLKMTRQRLEEESKVRYKSFGFKDLRLRSLLLRSLRDVEQLVDLIISDKDRYARDSEWAETELFGLMFRMGLQEENEEERDVNIWDEPPDSDNNILCSQKEEGSGADDLPPIKAATLNKLVERLTNHIAHDLKFMKTFLMTYQSFTTPEKLLTKLIERYHVPSPKHVEPGSKEEEEFVRSVKRPIQLRVCNVVKNWIEKHFSDFKEGVLAQLRDFLDGTLVKDGHHGLSKGLNNAINKRLGGKMAARETVFAEEPQQPKIPKNIFQGQKLDIMDIDEEEIARQLTCIEFDIYAAIQPTELLNQAWSKPKLQHRAPNVRGFASRFNQFSNWVATKIVCEEKVRQRARVWMKFIKIAEYLRAMNNFNSLIAIGAGFNNSAVHRLKFTKEQMGKVWEGFGELERATSSSQSYKGYREILHSADPPCVPYLGVYLTDLTFVEDGNPDTISGLINFSKRKLVYNVILEVQQYQQRPYNLQPVHQIQQLLLRLRAIPENDLYRMSVLREPRKADRSQIQ